MDSCAEPSKMQNENASELSNHVEKAPLLAAVRSPLNEYSRSSKRFIPVDLCSTPTKQPKVTHVLEHLEIIVRKCAIM